MSTSFSLPPFDSSEARIGMLRLSNILGPAEWLAFYIRLIPTETLRTELHLLFMLLEGRVDASDLWQIVGWCMVAAQNEELLRSNDGHGGRRVIAERTFMEEKWARCGMEVSLHSQAIDHIEQCRFFPQKAVPVTHKSDVRSFSTTSRHVVAPVACSVAVQEKCRAWLLEQDIDIPLAIGQSTLAHQEKRTSVIVNSIGPSFALLSTWVTTRVQEVFDKARKVELTSLAELMPTYLDIKTHHRDFQLELLVLRTMRCRARAESLVYSMAIDNAPASNDSDSDTFTPSSLSEQMCSYDEDLSDDHSDDDNIDCDDVW